MKGNCGIQLNGIAEIRTFIGENIIKKAFQNAMLAKEITKKVFIH